MAGKTFEAVPLYVGTLKIGTLESLSLSVTSNGEQILGSDGWLGESTGIVTSEGTFDTVVATNDVQDPASLFFTLVNDQVYVNVGVFIGNKFYTIDGKLTKADIKSTNKSGKVTGNFSFRGAKPTPVS
jgi:hypothetical protein